MRAICKNNSRLLLCPFHRVVFIDSEAWQLFYLLRIQFWKVCSWVYNLDVRTRQDGERLKHFQQWIYTQVPKCASYTKATKQKLCLSAFFFFFLQTNKYIYNFFFFFFFFFTNKFYVCCMVKENVRVSTACIQTYFIQYIGQTMVVFNSAI